jgi:type I restriction enzyme S subunit
MSAIPVGWVVQNLGAVATLQRGYDLPHKDRKRGSIPVITSSGFGDTHSESRVIGPGVVTGRYGTIGQVFYVIEDFWPLNTTLYIKDFHGNDPLFIAHLLRTIDFHSHSGKSGVPGVNRNDLHELIVHLAPVPEQRAIATALSDVDALLTKLDQFIAKKRDLKQAAMQQLLTGQKRLPGFSGEWEVKRLGELLNYEQPTKYLVSSSEYNDSNDVPVLTAGKTFVLGYTHETEGVFANLPAIIFDDFTTATKFVNFPFKAKSSAMKILKPRNPSVNLRLVYEIMQLIDFKLGDHKRHWISEYSKLDVKLPEVTEQTAIATVLSDMDGELAALEARRDKTRALKQGMMQELLTGRIRLV